jgi:hypothetical protein
MADVMNAQAAVIPGWLPRVEVAVLRLLLEVPARGIGC